jgi:hypothetical protein
VINVSNKETIIADHSETYVMDIDNNPTNTYNEISIYDLAAILNMQGDKFNISVFKRDMTLFMPAIKTKLTKVKLEGEWSTVRQRLKEKGWVAEAQKFLRDIKMSSSSKRAGELFCLLGVSSKHSTYFSISFSYNEKTKQHSMYCSSSPSKMLTGQNQLPIKMSENPEIRADEWLKLYTLPVYLIYKAVFDKIHNHEKSVLSKTWQEKRIYLTRLQMTAYSKPFESVTRMRRAITLLHGIYSANIHELGDYGTGGTSVARALGGRLEDSLTSFFEEDEKQVEITNEKTSYISGFTFIRKYGGKHMFALSFYDKKRVTEEKEDKDTDDLPLNSIRLDLTLYSPFFNKTTNDFLNIENKDYSMSYGDLREWFTKLFELDLTAGNIFSCVISKYLKMSNLLNTTKQQWDVLFDKLKEVSYYAILEGLQQGEAWTSCVEKQNEMRTKQGLKTFKIDTLKEKLEKHVYDQTGREFDLSGSYLLWKTARVQLYNMYTDLNELIKWHEINDNKTNYDPTLASKKARMEAKMICNFLSKGKLEPVKALSSIAGKAGKIKSTFDEVPF